MLRLIRILQFILIWMLCFIPLLNLLICVPCNVFSPPQHSLHRVQVRTCHSQFFLILLLLIEVKTPFYDFLVFSFHFRLQLVLASLTARHLTEQDYSSSILALSKISVSTSNRTRALSLLGQALYHFCQSIKA